ncbi:PREDICTED: uncharacterized protein LOC106746315 [Dinoponera quadriceps]|uniref:Uncharacterized protein LOC106746315 n=1 Tax=Dinoponera quadriceps TaxID=609295 RepID=A0A6P3XIL3_DINQU|nr:PREDICTED: uncharacterized protein LOC106746315 [Dinoponera quadriceps]
MAMTIRALLFFGAILLTLGEISAAPRRYDQRQEGDFNVHAQLENLLFVVAIPSSNDVLSELALQALELKHQLGSSTGIVPPPKDPESDVGTLTAFSEPDDDQVRADEVYITSTEGARRSEDRPENADEKASGSEHQQEVTSTAKSSGEEGRPIGREAKSAKGFDSAKSQGDPVIPGHLGNAKETLGSKTEDSDRARNVVGSPDVEPGRPGASMKKQLFRRGLGEDVAPPATTFVVGAAEQQEMKLLGDGIENCGPGRRRDPAGVCGFDAEHAGSPP